MNPIFSHIINASFPAPPPIEQPLKKLFSLIWNPDIDDSQIAFQCLTRGMSVSWGDLRESVSAHASQAQRLDADACVIVPNDKQPDSHLLGAFLGILLAGNDVVLPMTIASDVWKSLSDIGPTAILGKTPTEFESLVQMEWTPPKTNPTAPEDNVTNPRYWVQTSGSSGQPKWVSHNLDSILRLIEAHHLAGLMAPEKLGGAVLCPLFSHTMGLRSVLLALSVGSPILFISPKDLEERPVDLIAAIRKHPPEMLYCGPGLLEDIYRFSEFFPIIKREVFPKIRTIVSSGAQFNRTVPNLIPDAQVVNAFGMTESHVLSNGLLSPQNPTSLNGLLPGVRFGLETFDESKENYKLWISSPYMGNGYSSKPDFQEWFDTGDIIKYGSDKALTFVGRATSDFLQNGSGWKLSKAELSERHSPFPPIVQHVEWSIQPRNSSLTAIIWIGDNDPTDPENQSTIKEWFIWCHRKWQQNGAQPLFIQQMHCTAAGLLSGFPEKNALGKLTPLKADDNLHQILADPLVRHPNKVEIPNCYGKKGLFAQVFPRRSVMLAALNLDWEYVNALGDTVTGTRGSVKAEIIDMVGGYGCNLLGHHHPELIAAQKKTSGIAFLTQGSKQTLLANFCSDLSQYIGKETGRNYVCCPSNTGAEAVELAIKHSVLQRNRAFVQRQSKLRQNFANKCPDLLREVLSENERLFKRRKPPVIVLKQAFHGKSVATLNFLGDDCQRDIFNAVLGIRRIALPPEGGQLADDRLESIEKSEHLTYLSIEENNSGWSRVEKSITDILAVLVEPILGEGGIREVPEKWLKRLSHVDAPFIVDEIQSGMGRTGTVLASKGVTADIVLLGKALGGGLCKIGMTLIDRSVYLPEFDDFRSTTFSESNFSTHVAHTALRTLISEKACEAAERIGKKLKSKLLELQSAFPLVIKDVRGRGLMLGIEFAYPNQPYTVALAALAKAGLGYLLASYLLNRHQVRFLPTQSAPTVLRLEPSIKLTTEQMDKTIYALKSAAEALNSGNLFELAVHLVDENNGLSRKRELAASYVKRPKTKGNFLIEYEEPMENAIRVAFVHDPVNINKLLLADCPPMAMLTSTERMKLLQRFELLLSFSPMPSFAKNIMNGKIWLRGITMPLLPQTIKYVRQRKEFSTINAALQSAVEVGEAEGCSTIVLGAQTSVLSQNATTLLANKSNTTISSGNTFTTAAALHNINRQVDIQSIKSIAVVGALGNIGSAIVRYLALFCSDFRGSLHLYGRHNSEIRLEKLKNELCKESQLTIDIETDLLTARSRELIIIAISSNAPILSSEHFDPDDKCIVADISQPPAITEKLHAERPNLKILEPAMITLPNDPDFQLSAHSKPGEIFACAAEGIVSALTPHNHDLVGDISAEATNDLLKAGIALGLLK